MDSSPKLGSESKQTGVPLYLQGSAASARSANFGEAVISPELSSEEEPELNTNIATASSPSATSLSGQGPTTRAVNFGLSLRGRTDASFSNSFSTENVEVTPATGCKGCGKGACIRATGTLVSTFQVSTKVTLPSVSDFPKLTPCQRDRVQNAITNVLAPHEQEHVDAYNAYNGTERIPFDLTICRAKFDSSIESMHKDLEKSRRASAKGASDALDPFVFDVDLNCEDSPPKKTSAAEPDKSAPLSEPTDDDRAALAAAELDLEKDEASTDDV